MIMLCTTFFFMLGFLASPSFSEDPPKQVDIDDLIKNIFKTPDDGLNPSPTPHPVPVSTTAATYFPEPATETKSGNNGVKESPSENYKSCGFERECVPRFLCQDDSINTDGTNIIDIRIDGAECGYLEVCCDIGKKGDKPLIDLKPTISHNGCGFRNKDGVGFRITGNHDNEAEFGEFPWMVAILREEKAASEVLNIYECGGALIAPNAVITAAHCVNNRQAEELLVRAGEWDTQSKAEVLPYQDLFVKEIILHERFNRGSLSNDIAVLLLDGGFEWQENIRPICLPNSEDSFDHSRCFATGWGKNKFGADGQYQVILKKIDLPIVPRNTCQANLRSTRLGKYFQLHESFICAGGEKGKDTCKGDGGSPLACPLAENKDQFYHVGIVAWGIGCGEANIPGVYANVQHLRPWLENKLSLRGVEFNHFTA